MPALDPAKLVRADYADRAIAGLGSRRHIDDTFLSKWVGDFNPDNVTIRDRYRMRQDSMIKMGLHYSKAPMITADYQFLCDDAQIRAAVKQAYERIHVGLMRTALCMYDFGYQGCIKRWELGKLEGEYENENGDLVPIWPYKGVQPVMMAVPVPLMPEHTRVELVDGKFTGMRAAMQPSKRQANTDDDLVPIEHSLWFTNEFHEEFGDYYGRARIDSAYRFWWSYWFNFHNRDRHAENDADPALQIWYPVGSRVPDSTDIDPDTGRPRVVDNLTTALQVGDQLRSGATIAWPSDVHTDEQGRNSTAKLWEAGFLTGGENISAFTDLLADLEISKLRACLVPEQALIQQRNAPSSRNVAGTYGEVFTESLGLDARYLDEQITQYLIRPFVVANFGEDAPICRKVTTGFKEDDLTLTTSLIQAAFNADPNALPIKWEEMMQRANVPTYTQKELEEKQAAEQELQQQQQQQQQPPAPDEAAQPEQLMQSGPRKYERERIWLSGQLNMDADDGVQVDAPRLSGWAKQEAKRRQKTLAAIDGQMGKQMRDYYQRLFDEVARALQSNDVELAVADFVNSLLNKIQAWLARWGARQVPVVAAELADVYMAGVALEVDRLGLDAESWDIGHERAAEWAQERAGELVVTMSDTVVQQFLRPWLTEQFQQLGYDGQDRTRGGIPLDTERLVAGLRQHFESYPEWMAERVVRTEARIALNQAAFGVWEDAGIEELIAIDGLGGRTGKTDATCLARNGRTFSLDEARAEDALEHPNGTLFWVPSMVAVTESRPAARPQAASLLASGPYTLRSGALRARRRFWI